MTKQEIKRYWALRAKWVQAGASYPANYTEPRTYNKVNPEDAGYYTSAELKSRGMITIVQAAKKYETTQKALSCAIERRKWPCMLVVCEGKRVRAIPEREVITYFQEIRRPRESSFRGGLLAELP